MKKNCVISGEVFEIPPEDIKFYRSAGLPLPTLCPQERHRRRITFRNFRNLYHRKCDGTGKKILSMYDADAPFPVYESSYWWTDSWSALDYGREINFNRPFFVQYKELANQVPHFNLSHVRTENCTYSNMVIDAKNCYLVFGCVRDEDCLYGHIVWDSQNCVDNLYAYRCQWCSHNIDVVDCYDVHFSFETSGSQESYFLYDCAHCKNCFGCFNLRNKQYCIFNRQLSPEAYQEELKKYFPLSWTGIARISRQVEEAHKKQAISPHMFGLLNENVSGNHIYGSRNTFESFDAKNCEDAKHLFTAFGVRDSSDMSFIGASCEFCYECLTTGGSNDVWFSHGLNNCQNSFYSEFCYYSHDVFGCNGLRNAAYCIFNRQYSKEDYSQLKNRLIDHMKRTGEWGEYFPSSLSPYAYNESIAQEYMPLTKEEVLRRGLHWKEEQNNIVSQASAHLPPEFINQCGDDILNQTYTCQSTGKPFRIIKAELDFYRRINLPLPRLCPEARHLDRMKKRLPRRLRSGHCGSCGMEIASAYEAPRQGRVYCEKCYLGALYD